MRKEFESFCDAQLRTLRTDVPPILYHYTSVAGMRGILETGRLRAYNIGLMNDLTEVRYSASVFRAHLDRAYAIEDDSLACDLFNLLRQKVASIKLGNVFLLSLSRRGDAPGMWRLYSDRGTGFSLALPTDVAGEWDGYLVQCNYSSDTLDEFCLSTIAEIRSLYLQAVRNGSKPDPEGYASLFLRNVVWFLPIFKHRVWRDEDEWRFIFIRASEHHKQDIEGRTYIEVPAAGGLPIRAIYAGIDCDYDECVVPLRKLLIDSHLEHVPFHLSQHSPRRSAGALLPLDRP